MSNYNFREEVLQECLELRDIYRFSYRDDLEF